MECADAEGVGVGLVLGHGEEFVDDGLCGECFWGEACFVEGDADDFVWVWVCFFDNFVDDIECFEGSFVVSEVCEEAEF